MLDNAFAFGLESLVGDAVPFVNCTRQVLVSSALDLLPTLAVLELLETLEVDNELIQACQRLKDAGFRLALDDYDGGQRWEPLLPLVDFIKVDIRLTDAVRRAELLRRCCALGKVMIAEKVETDDEYRALLSEGFQLFQGYFFAHPIVTARPSTPSLTRKLELVHLMRWKELPLQDTLDLVHQESSLAIRLLRLANSARYSRGDVIMDLKSAYLHVGDMQFRTMALFVLGHALCGTLPLEFHRTVLVQSRFCELSASSLGAHDGEMFVFGMLSVLKDPLHIDVEALATGGVVTREVADALSGMPTTPLCSLLECATTLRLGRWSRLATTADHLKVPVNSLAGFFREAQRWADQVLHNVASSEHA